MNIIQSIRNLLAKPFFSDSRTLFGLWLLLPIIAAVTKFHSYNNFKIFRGVFWHTWHETPLYTEYPSEYFDTNHYGPLFSLIIAPFALLPAWFGLLFWLVCMSLLLYWATSKLSLNHRQKIFYYYSLNFLFVFVPF